MAETAFQTAYRNELIATFEVTESLLAQSVTDEAVISGNSAVFLVAGSGDATAVTRGVNGRIPGRANDLTQVTCTLTEWHDKPEMTGFNVFASQSGDRIIRKMQMDSAGVVNRKKDSQILTELATATNDTGASVQGSLDLVVYAQTILGNNKVPLDAMDVTAVISPAFNGYLNQIPEYASADYVEVKPLASGTNAYAGRKKAKRWMDCMWIVHPELTGVGTATEKCFMYHRSAIGHAHDTAGMKSYVGYNEEDDFSFARCSGYMGAKLLQNSGVVVINHDGSNYAAQ